jgi:hypothetical protein
MISPVIGVAPVVPEWTPGESPVDIVGETGFLRVAGLIVAQRM